MKGINKTDVLKDSIDYMESKHDKSLLLTDKKPINNNAETEKNATESIIANDDLHFKNKDRNELTNELILANKKLAFEYKEKDKCAAELVIAISELNFQNEEKEKRASELVIANNELLFQNLEKEKKAVELIFANSELKIAEEKLKEYIKGLEEMMFITSHKVRQPIANILGFSSMLHQTINSPDDVEKAVACIKKSAITLDTLTRELNSFICELGHNKDSNDEEIQ